MAVFIAALIIIAAFYLLCCYDVYAFVLHFMRTADVYDILCCCFLSFWFLQFYCF